MLIQLSQGNNVLATPVANLHICLKETQYMFHSLERLYWHKDGIAHTVNPGQIGSVPFEG
jgi:hypothetical protein